MYYGSMLGKSAQQQVFVCLLAHCDRDGNGEMPVPLIATLTGLDHDTVSGTLAELSSPDPASRSKDEEGRRILLHGNGFGYTVVNYETYRSMRDEEARREQTKHAVRRHRVKVSHGKPDVSHGKPVKAQAEAEAEAEADRSKHLSPATPLTRARWGGFFDAFWQAYPHVAGRSRRKVAAEAWGRIWPKTLETRDRIMAGIEACRKGPDWAKDGGAYVPGAQVWLRQAGWDASEGTASDVFVDFLAEGEA